MCQTPFDWCDGHRTANGAPDTGVWQRPTIRRHASHSKIKRLEAGLFNRALVWQTCGVNTTARPTRLLARLICCEEDCSNPGANGPLAAPVTAQAQCTGSGSLLSGKSSLCTGNSCRSPVAHTLLAVAASALFAVANAASVAPVNLKCEYLENPIGIDAAKPRLSWVLVPTQPTARGQRQTGYRILVASSPEILRRDKGDVWDSGMVESDNSQHVVYEGKRLRSNQECYWKVRVRDERRTLSPWSKPARWTTGILDASDWSAKWIGTGQSFVRKQGWPPPDNTMPDPWLRRVFVLDAVPKRAIIHVASVGYHELYVNGKRVGDGVLAPCTTDHTKRARYVTYEIAELLRRGTNVIGLWLGTSWSIFPPYQTTDKPAAPIVLAQADIEFGNGRSTRIITDDQWKWHPSPNTLIGMWDFTNFGGERYDAGREIPNWCEVTLDDSSWQPVTVFSPTLILSAQNVEPNRPVRELRPVKLEEPGPGIYRVDFGKNFAGWIEAKIEGQPGDVIEFKWSERKEEPMTHRLHSYYVVGPSGKGVFKNRFNYGAGRWVQIEGLRQKPKLEDFKAWLIRTDYAPVTQFECSNPWLNRVHDATVWTFENLSLGGYVVDCPQRERMGYGGDAHATTETALDHFALGAFYTKWAQDWRDVQGKEAAWGIGRKEGEAGSGKKIEPGNLPYTAPTYWGGGGPGWSGYCVTLPWEIFRRYGDHRILEQSLPTIEKWLAFLETKAKNNLLRRWGGEWDFLGDWLWPGAEGVNGDTRETLFFNNCYWVYNLQTASRIAAALGRTDLAEKYRNRAAEVRSAIHREFYVPEEHSYVNGYQAYLAIALLTGVPPEELRPAVMDRLEKEILVNRKGHFWGGITGGSFIVKCLIEQGRPDLMYEMVTKEDYPGWIHMLRNGATTLWEDWEGKLSLCHSSYLHVGAWFVEGLAGIRPGTDGHGYKDFIIRPGIWSTTPLEWVKCRFVSPYGPIESDWRRNTDGDVELHVVVPPNTKATLFLPTTRAESVRERGRPITAASEIGLLPVSGNCLPVRLGPGRYSFQVSGN